MEPGRTELETVGNTCLERVFEDSILGRAAQLSFYFLLAVFPMLFVLLVIFSQFAGSVQAIRPALISYLSSIAPQSASELVDSVLKQISQGGGSGVSFAAVVAIWSASSGMVAIIAALNRAYEVDETRSWWKQRGIAILLTFALIALIGTALVLLTYGAPIAAAIASHFGLGSVFTTTWAILRWPVVIGFVLLAFNLMYLYAPNVKHWAWHWLMPGTVVAVVIWLLASFGFDIYLNYFGSYNATYGSLGAVIFLLLWFYVTGIAILVGAGVNSEIEGASDKIGGSEKDSADSENGPRQNA